MADMPYKAVTLPTLWQILWILYNYQLTSTPSTVLVQSTSSQSGTGQSTSNQQIPQSVDEILAAIKGERLVFMYGGISTVCLHYQYAHSTVVQWNMEWLCYVMSLILLVVVVVI